MKKRLLFFTLILAIACMLAISVSAFEYNGVYYTANGSNATVSTDNKTSCTLSEVEIPEIVYDESNNAYTVTAVAASAFGDTSSSNANQTITSVVLPNTITSVGAHAFRECSALVSVKLSSGLTTLVNATFLNCTNLTTVDVNGAQLTALDSYVFRGCSKLTGFDMPSTVKSIGTETFKDCFSLVSISLPVGLDSIGSSAFRSCGSMSSVTLPSTVRSIGSCAFYGCSGINGDIVIAEDVSFGSDAFRECSNLKSIIIKAPLTSFSTHSFYKCTSLETVVLPESLTEISTNCFQGCSSLKNISIPSSVTKIKGWAFNGCTSLTSIDFPSGLTEIGDNCFQNTGLTSVVLPEALTTTGKDIFNSCPIVTAVIPADLSAIASTIFSSCSSLKAVIYTGDDGSTAQSAISQLSSFTIDSFENYDPSISYTTKTIFAGAKRSSTDYRVLVDFNGFDKTFRIIDMTALTAVSYRPMFTALGYSANESGSGFATGFEIDHDSISAYEKVFDKKVGFGIVVFNPKYLGADSFFVNGIINSTAGAVQVKMDTTYTTCSLSISGFDLENNESHMALELVFAGYAYTDDDMSTAQLIQKEYTGTADATVASPMANKVTRGNDVLYTVKLQGIITPQQIAYGKDGLNEF